MNFMNFIEWLLQAQSCFSLSLSYPPRCGTRCSLATLILLIFLYLLIQLLLWPLSRDPWAQLLKNKSCFNFRCSSLASSAAWSPSWSIISMCWWVILQDMYLLNYSCWSVKDPHFTSKSPFCNSAQFFHQVTLLYHPPLRSRWQSWFCSSLTP